MNEIQIKLTVNIFFHERIIKNRAEIIIPSLKDILNISNLKDIWVEDMNKFSFELPEGYPVNGTLKCNRIDITFNSTIATPTWYEAINFFLFKKRKLKKRILATMKNATKTFY